MTKNKLINAVTIILFVLLFFNVTFIWFNSFITSETSNNSSKKVAEIIQPIVDPYYKITKETFMDYIRKSAHFTEFLSLGVIISTIHLIIKKTRIFTILFVLLSIAVIDELIQTLSDRTASVNDIILDFFGAVTGLAAVIVIYFIAKLIFTKIKYRTTNMIKRSDTQ